MPDNLNIREQIAKSYFRAMLVAMSSYEPNILRTWESATDSMRKPCLEMADLLFSTPILERTCPECGGKGGWLITSTNIGVIQGWQKCECKSGKVPFTVGDAINKAIKELK